MVGHVEPEEVEDDPDRDRLAQYGLGPVGDNPFEEGDKELDSCALLMPKLL